MRASLLFFVCALDSNLYFGKYRTMEREAPSPREVLPDTRPTARLFESQREPIMSSVLTGTVLSELKRQAPAGCVLCFLDAWDEEEWD